MNTYRLSVDPGYGKGGGGTGLCLWEERQWKQCVPPFKSFIITPDGAEDEFVRCRLIAAEFDKVFCKYIITHTYCEQMAVFSGSAKGNACAASGALIQLAALTGMLDIVATMRKSSFEYVPIRDWKGNMSKGAVESRITRRIGMCPQSHCADACGIGLFKKKFFSPKRN